MKLKETFFCLAHYVRLYAFLMQDPWGEHNYLQYANDM